MPPRNPPTNDEDPNIEKHPDAQAMELEDEPHRTPDDADDPEPEPDPLPTTDGFDYLQAANRDPLRLWRTKAPKGAGEVICVLCQDVDEVVLIHQRAQRFTIYARI